MTLDANFWTMVAALATTATAILLLWERLAASFRRPPIRASLRLTPRAAEGRAREYQILIQPPASGSIFIDRLVSPRGIEIALKEQGPSDGFGNYPPVFAWGQHVDVAEHIAMGHEPSPFKATFWARPSSSASATSGHMKSRQVLTLLVWADRRRRRLQIEIPDPT